MRFKTLRRLRQSGLTWRELGAAFSINARRASDLYNISQWHDAHLCYQCKPARWHDCLEHLEKKRPGWWRCSYCHSSFYEPIEAYRLNRGWE